MRRYRLPLFLFAVVFAGCLILGHRLGRKAGEATVRARFAGPAPDTSEASAPAATPLGAPAPAATASARRSRTRDEVNQFLNDLARLMFRTEASPGSVRLSLDESRIRRELDQLNLEEVREALELAAERPPGMERAGLMMALISRWGRDDPPAAFAYVREHADQAGPMAAFWPHSIFPQWAERDPRTAARELAGVLAGSKEFSRGSLGNTVFAVFERLAQADLGAAIHQADALPDWAQRSARSAAAKQVHTPGRGKLLDAIQAMPPGPEKRSWQVAAATAMAPVDSAAASRWLDQLGLPETQSAQTTREVFASWKNHDPRGASAWALARLPESEHGNLLAETVESWAAREPNECGRWLGELAPGPITDAAIEHFARAIADKDPESARAWASRITDRTLSEKCLEGINSASR